ncbi:MAG: putative nucleic acid-binding Zn-ribbon protein [Glaciecola sp.]|jgi:predicted SnoaL-like aldol condensation-catalyzing enzyme
MTMTKTATSKPETVETVETVETNNSESKYSVDSYFETMEKGAEKMAESFAQARERNTRIMNQFVESVTSGQKDFIELGRTVATQPTDYRANMQAMLDTMNRRQACALELGKTVYKEQSEVSSAVSENMGKVFAPLKNANYDWTAPYKKMAEYWVPATK